MADIGQAIEEVMSHEERAVLALETIGEALTSLAKLGAQIFDKLYPEKKARDAIVTKIPSPEDELRESLGSTGEPIEEWVGLRESEVISQKK